MKRMTKQQIAILKPLKETSRPLSIRELHAFAAQEVTDINLSTLYRNLKILKSEGTIASITLPGEKVHYELATPAHRHHFLCQECEKLFNIFSCPKGLSEMVPAGFILTGHTILLEGFCQECAPI